MTYTLWSHGILVGVTDFSLGAKYSRHLAGVLQPAETGMMFLPALTAMAPALFDLDARMKQEHLLEEDADTDVDGVLDVFEQSLEGQRVIASAKEAEQLELRAPNGRVLEIESILVSDLMEMKRFGLVTTPMLKRTKDCRQRDDPIRYLISATLAAPDGNLLA